MRTLMRKNSRMWQHILACVLLCSVCCIVASQFVVPGSQKTQSKTGKVVSKSKLQETCCQEIVSILRELPQLLKSVADMQQEGMKHVCGFVEGDGACVLKQANVRALQQMHTELTNMAQSIRSMRQKCDQYALKMRSLC